MSREEKKNRFGLEHCTRVVLGPRSRRVGLLIVHTGNKISVQMSICTRLSLVVIDVKF